MRAGEDKTFDVCVVQLAMHGVPGACFDDRLLYQSDDAETKLRHLELVAHLVFMNAIHMPRTDSTRTRSE